MSATMASSPFDRPAADVVLRSADNVDFRVYSQILTMASSVFDDMVVVAHPDKGDSTDGRETPVIPLTENSDTLDALLRLCYPIEKPGKARSLEDIPPILTAALKYLMPLPISVLKKEVIAFAQIRPLQVWAIGCQLCLEDMARVGAEAALHFKDLGTYNYLREFVPVKDFLREARGVSAGDYFRLVEFHRLAGDVPSMSPLTRPMMVGDDNASLMSGTTRVADKFFASLPYPDLICRAEDGAEFPVHKGLLCMASPVLSDKVAAAARSFVPSSEGEKAADAKLSPILGFAEDGGVLAALLRFCYPGPPVFPGDDMSLFLSVLDAAETYKMTQVVDSLKSHWAEMAARVPLSAYFAATQTGLHREARVAARHSLQMSLRGKYVAEMESSPPQVYQRLIEYHDRAHQVATTVALAYDVWQGPPIRDTTGESGSISAAQRKERNKTGKKPFHADEERCNGGCQGFQGESWLRERRESYLRHLAEGPGKPFLSDVVLFRNSATYNLGGPAWCACCFRLASGIVRLGTSLPEKIHAELDKIEL